MSRVVPHYILLLANTSKGLCPEVLDPLLTKFVSIMTALTTPLDNASWPIPDVWVMVSSEQTGILREILPDGGYKVQLASATDAVDFVTAQLADLDLIAPRKGDNIKIVSGEFRGLTGKLIGIDGNDGIVKLDGNMDIKILDMSNLGKVST